MIDFQQPLNIIRSNAINSIKELFKKYNIDSFIFRINTEDDDDEDSQNENYPYHYELPCYSNTDGDFRVIALTTREDFFNPGSTNFYTISEDEGGHESKENILFMDIETIVHCYQLLYNQLPLVIPDTTV